MGIKYYVCKKCARTFAGPARNSIVCAALVGFVIKDGKDIPVGCGGDVLETTRDAIMAGTYRREDE